MDEEPSRPIFLLGEIGEGLRRARPPALRAPRSRWKPWAAAAAVLLGLGLWRLGFREPRSAPSSPSGVLSAVRGQTLEAGPEGLRLVWKDGGAARLSPSSRAVLERGILLERGELWARLHEEVLCRTSVGTLKGGGDWTEFRIRLDKPRVASLLKEAEAGEPPVVELLSGAATWAPSDGGKEVPLKPAGRLEAGRAETLSPRGPDRAFLWGAERTQGDYAWEAVVEAGPGSGWGVAFQCGNETRLWVLAPESRGSGPVRVGIRRWGGRFVGEISGRVAWSCSEGDPALLRFPGVEGGGAAGIAAWGAPVKVQGVRFLADRSPAILVEDTP